MVAWFDTVAQGTNLSVGRTELRTEISNYVGWGYAVPSDTAKLAKLDGVIRMGLRQVYDPPPLDGAVHEWSFRKPNHSLSLLASVGDYDLPFNFGGIEGKLTFDPTQTGAAIEMRGEGLIRELRQQYQGSSGPPRLAAIRPRTLDQGSLIRWEIIFWPTPGQVYTVTFRYNALPHDLSDDRPYPLGTAQHSELFLQSCRAAAEQVFNDERGVEYEKFMERLAAHIASDRAMMKLETFGYNSDGGRAVADEYGLIDSGSTLTYNGTLVN